MDDEREVPIRIRGLSLFRRSRIDKRPPSVLRRDRFVRRWLPAVALGAGTALSMTTMVAAPAASGTTEAQSAMTAAAARCSTSNVHGVQTIAYCGPATATLRIGGKTYSFQDGECVSIHVSGITVDLTLGAIAEDTKSGTSVKGNSGKPYFSLDLSHGQKTQLLNPVDYGGKQLTKGGPVIATGTIAASGSSKGTFTSAQGADDLSGEPLSVSGSWNCHGAFAKH